jgi:hypothetical protein
MTDNSLKSGNEILNEYFRRLANNPEIDEDLRNTILELWKQKRLYTKTYLLRALDELRERKTR